MGQTQDPSLPSARSLGASLLGHCTEINHVALTSTLTIATNTQQQTSDEEAKAKPCLPQSPLYKLAHEQFSSGEKGAGTGVLPAEGEGQPDCML